jgi:hypothetical protein
MVHFHSLESIYHLRCMLIELNLGYIISSIRPRTSLLLRMGSIIDFIHFLQQMFQTPALIVVSIAATRMYRSLTNFRSSDCRTFPLLPSTLS